MAYLASLKPGLGSDKSRNQKISEGGSIDQKGENVLSFGVQECALSSGQKIRKTEDK